MGTLSGSHALSDVQTIREAAAVTLKKMRGGECKEVRLGGRRLSALVGGNEGKASFTLHSPGKRCKMGLNSAILIVGS